MKLVNLTPHALNIDYRQEGGKWATLVLPPSGLIARCTQTSYLFNEFEIEGGEIQVRRVSYGDVSGLPDPQPDTVYITSLLAANAARRPDVLYPGEAIRDPNGVIVGCSGLTSVTDNEGD